MIRDLTMTGLLFLASLLLSSCDFSDNASKRSRGALAPRGCAISYDRLNPVTVTASINNDDAVSDGAHDCVPLVMNFASLPERLNIEVRLIRRSDFISRSACMEVLNQAAITTGDGRTIYPVNISSLSVLEWSDFALPILSDDRCNTSIFNSQYRQQMRLVINEYERRVVNGLSIRNYIDEDGYSVLVTPFSITDVRNNEVSLICVAFADPDTLALASRSKIYIDECIANSSFLVLR